MTIEGKILHGEDKEFTIGKVGNKSREFSHSGVKSLPLTLDNYMFIVDDNLRRVMITRSEPADHEGIAISGDTEAVGIHLNEARLVTRVQISEQGTANVSLRSNPPLEIEFKHING